MNALKARKALLLAEADLHRQILTLERSQWRERAEQARQLAGEQRWWLIGGAALLGVACARRWRDLAGWLPTIVRTARALLR